MKYEYKYESGKNKFKEAKKYKHLEALPACMYSVQGGRVKSRPSINIEMYPFFEASYIIVREMG